MSPNQLAKAPGRLVKSTLLTNNYLDLAVKKIGLVETTIRHAAYILCEIDKK